MPLHCPKEGNVRGEVLLEDRFNPKIERSLLPGYDNDVWEGPVVGKYVCPVCEREVDDAIIPFHRRVEKQIIELIQRSHPRWMEPDGSSPKSVDYYKALIENKLLR